MKLGMKLEADVDMYRTESKNYKELHDREKEQMEEYKKKYKIAGRELIKLKEQAKHKDDELEAAKKRIARVIVERHGEKLGSPKKGLKAPERPAERQVMSPQKWKAKGSSSIRNKASSVHESLSRAEGSLNAARRIMMSDVS